MAGAARGLPPQILGEDGPQPLRATERRVVAHQKRVVPDELPAQMRSEDQRHQEHGAAKRQPGSTHRASILRRSDESRNGGEQAFDSSVCSEITYRFSPADSTFW